MKSTYLNKYVLLLGLVLSLTACIEDEVVPLTDQGTPLLKFQNGPQQSLFFLPFLESKKIKIFDLRRDANSSKELQTTRTVVIQADSNLIKAYNKENDTEFELLPESIYALNSDPSIVKSGDKITITFGPGEFVKNLYINLDGSKWDLSKKFALAFKVLDAGGASLSSDRPSVLTTISIKNKYDGTYEVKGTMVDVVNPALTHVNDYYFANGKPAIQLVLKTVSATKCALFDPVVWHDYFVPITSGGTAVSGYGTFAPIFEFDLNTDKVVDVTNYYGTPSNTRGGRLDPTGAVNAYNSSNKTLTIKYNMTQRSLVPVAPHVRTTWDEVWKYLHE